VTTNMKLTALAAHHAGKLFLPPGYHIQIDAEMLVLHRADGSMVGGFVAGRTAPSEVVTIAEEDYRASNRERGPLTQAQRAGAKHQFRHKKSRGPLL
jgi:hypothetical protein